jgi:hypothetical protein
MSEKAKTPKRTKTSERTKTPDRGKHPMAQASQTLAPDYTIMEQFTPPSQVRMIREPRAVSVSCGRNRERMAKNDHSPGQRSRKRKVLAEAHSGSGDRSWEGTLAAEDYKEEVTPSPNMRKIFTRLQE